MDSLITAAARALASGDMLGALNRVALREDAAALALRGIAMAQLGEHGRARDLLRRAGRAFGAHEALARARCVVAEAEVALAVRDLEGSARALAAATRTLALRGDVANASLAELIGVRRALLLGRLADAENRLRSLDAQPLPPALAAVAALARAELALRSLDTTAASAALAVAGEAARRSGVTALEAEVEDAGRPLERPAARQRSPQGERLLRLQEVASLMASGTLIVDACRRGVRAGGDGRPLNRRPILFTLARCLAEAWPGAATREQLIATVFRTRQPDETHRARLRVEVGRLRRVLAGLAVVDATPGGFALRACDGGPVTLLAPPVEGDHGALAALLADGAAWSTSSLALALGDSQRTVQRSLAELEAAGRARSIGRGRAQRWLAPPLGGFTTILLLPASLAAE
ncbi:helix-turn-helix domain-containing protein [Rhizobacter sp. LjRoot28]|uniref:helix-turn-helix domain-containing protein n=1 Tax=Rhizobacter sp. LjRoot28 TaxID=3342309 RepID=UPI003ED05521